MEAKRLLVHTGMTLTKKTEEGTYFIPPRILRSLQNGKRRFSVKIRNLNIVLIVV